MNLYGISVLGGYYYMMFAVVATTEEEAIQKVKDKWFNIHRKEFSKELSIEIDFKGGLETIPYWYGDSK